MSLFSKTKIASAKRLFKQVVPLVLLLLFSVTVSGLVAGPSLLSPQQFPIGGSAQQWKGESPALFHLKALPGNGAETSFLAELEEQSEQNEDEVTPHFASIVFLYNCFFNAYATASFGTHLPYGKMAVPAISIYLLHGVMRL